MAKVFRVFLLLVVFLGGCDWLNPDSSNGNLINLTVTGGTIDPGFSPNVMSYSATVSAETDETSVVATVEHPQASMRINGERFASGVAFVVPLDFGVTTIRVSITAADGKNVKTYTLDVTRPEPTTFSIGGSVSGLSGTVTLQNNGGDDLAIAADGTFEFDTALDDGVDYEVTVSGQPASQECSVSNGNGTIAAADVTGVNVACVNLTYTVGGSVVGLSGDLTLQNNGGDDLLLTENGTFDFVTPLINGVAYDVTVSGQPAGQVCTVSNGNGIINVADVTNVSVSCVVPSFTVGGSISDLTGTMTLQNNAADDLEIAGNGPFTFSASVINGGSYDVTVSSQPEGQECVVNNASGTIAGGNVTNVSVECGAPPEVSFFDWKWVNPLPHGNQISDSASDGNQLVVVGHFGTILTTLDGSTWVTQDSGTPENLYGITWGDNEFMAVGDYGVVLTSRDGVTWTSQELGFYRFYKAIWNGSLYAMVGVELGENRAGVIATSPDGETWSFQTFAPEGSWEVWDIAWNGSMFAAVQLPGYIHTSPDGTTWTTIDRRADGWQQSIASDGNKFVSVGGNAILTSLDGVNWNTEAPSSPVAYPLFVEWRDGRFLAVGNHDFYSSADGSTWTTHVADTPTFINLTGATHFAGLSIVFGHRGHIASSPDDTIWTVQTTGDAHQALNDVIWDGSQFMAVGGGSQQTIRTSPDGINWTTQNSDAASFSLYGVTNGGGQYVAVGDGSGDQVLTSPDGLTWTGHSLSDNYIYLNSVIWGDDEYIAVGGDGLILTSPDGTTWTAQTDGIAATDMIYDVVWNGSVYVVTGNGDTYDSKFIASSPDGVTWTKHAVPAWAGFTGVAWSGDLFVAVAYSAVATSANGLDWAVSSASDSRMKVVTWDGSKFIAASWGSKVFVTTDAVNVTEHRANSGNFLSVASNGSRAVFVGPRGVIVYTDNL